MAITTGGVIGNCEPDKLIASVFPPAQGFTIDLKTPGEYKRGTVMSIESDGTYAVLGSGTGAASCVIAEDTKADENIAVAYRIGHFNINALIAADEYTITAADINNLRLAGIVLSEAV